MRHMYKRASVLAAVGLLAGVLAACGSSPPAKTGSGGGSGGTTATGGTQSTAGFAPGGTLKVLMGSPPDSLDPQFGYTTQAAEADWLVYTPLLTYAHASGLAGTKVIPGLATALPVLSNGDKTYTMTMRKGLTFSNGTAVKASDFTFAVERAIKLSWGGASFFTQNVVGAAAYQKGTAKTISGITADNSSGKITINLVAPYGAFENVLAFPAAAPVPPTTAMKALTSSPPPGVGPYMITSVSVSTGFTVKKNPKFAAFKLPGIPTGHVDAVDVTFQANNVTEAQDVLNNTYDEFDDADTLPPSLYSQVTAQKSRYRPEIAAETDYFFLNTRTKPFNNFKARQAVNLAVNRTALERVAAGEIQPACYFLPPAIIGHASGSCPDGSPTGLGSPADIAKAKALVKSAGLAGTPVTVWTESKQPRQAFVTYLEGQLNAIGFKATLKVIANGIYFQTIGNAKTNPQIGFADWQQDFPNPGDFYLLLDARAIQPVNNENFGNVNDSHIQSTIIKLDKVPASKLSSVAGQWAALERYVSGKDYMIPFGNAIFPLFLSTRVDFSKVIFHPLYGDDWSSFELKKA